MTDLHKKVSANIKKSHNIFQNIKKIYSKLSCINTVETQAAVTQLQNNRSVAWHRIKILFIIVYLPAVICLFSLILDTVYN